VPSFQAIVPMSRMPNQMQLRSVDAVAVVADGPGPHEAVSVEWTHHDALLEAQYLVGMGDWINTKR
jgi:hypothetical protein